MMPTMKLSPELEARILATPGVIVRHAQSIAAPVIDEPEPKKVELVEACVYRDPGRNWFWAMIPIATTSEINKRGWKGINRRNGAAWKAVSKTIGPRLDLLAPFAAAYHAGHGLMVKFTRLGGRRLDKSNLPSATKAVEDALAYMLGASDGDARWMPLFDQQPGGKCGVKIEIEVSES